VDLGNDGQDFDLTPDSNGLWSTGVVTLTSTIPATQFHYTVNVKPGQKCTMDVIALPEDPGPDMDARMFYSILIEGCQVNSLRG